MAKGSKGHKKGRRKGKKKDVMASAIKSGLAKGFGTKGRKSNKRPLKLLKWAANRMRTNLPKLEGIIKQREARGER
jgi:hypothetical protein